MWMSECASFFEFWKLATWVGCCSGGVPHAWWVVAVSVLSTIYNVRVNADLCVFTWSDTKGKGLWKLKYSHVVFRKGSENFQAVAGRHGVNANVWGAATVHGCFSRHMNAILCLCIQMTCVTRFEVKKRWNNWYFLTWNRQHSSNIIQQAPHTFSAPPINTTITATKKH